MCGLPFSGKTTLSKYLAKLLHAIRIDLDEVKVKLLGNIEDEKVLQEQWDRVYEDMYTHIKKNLSQGKSVIQDAGNFTRYERGLVRTIADKMNLQTVVIYVDVPLAVALERRMQNEQTKSRFHVQEETVLASAKEIEPPIVGETSIIYHGEPLETWVKQFIN
ncbi:MAG: hypothetical protein UX62_C0020G0002 [Microgenomates group bacterium GW2011_GWA2_46_7]|nr:MAG: hypothetical protein UX62_C0020G0002 [Microgenomates group bacterium GW2011_GWA2_46_7]